MKVILRKPVPGIGRADDIVDVAPAYARNFLLPKGLAQPARPETVAQLDQHKKKQAQELQARATQRASDRHRLTGQTVYLRVAANKQGKMFAAVRAKEILQALHTQHRVDIDQLNCRPDHFKTTGRHQLELLWPDHQSNPMTLVIEPDSDSAAAD